MSEAQKEIDIVVHGLTILMHGVVLCGMVNKKTKRKCAIAALLAGMAISGLSIAGEIFISADAAQAFSLAGAVTSSFLLGLGMAKQEATSDPTARSVV